VSVPPRPGQRGPGAVPPPGLDAGQVLDGLARAVGQASTGHARFADQYGALVGARAADDDYLGAAEFRGRAMAHEDAAAKLAAILAAFGLQPPERPDGAPGPAPLAAARPGPAAGAGLGGTGRLGDELYLVAHDDVTGKLRLHSRAVALGVAAGLLAELMLGGQLVAGAAGTLVAVKDAPAPGGALATRILAQVAAEREPLGMRDWLAFLAQGSLADVAARLAQAGYLEAVPARWPRGRDRWVPADQSRAFAAIVRARSALDPARPLTVAAAALAGLADAAGLRPLLLQYAPDPARTPAEIAGVLPPGLQDLITHARAAADSALLAGRT
jgi:hypothetical protein